MGYSFTPSSPAAFRLITEGARAFADIEANGMRIDVDYVKRMIGDTQARIRQYETELREDEVYQTWRKVYGEKADLGKRTQLAHIIFDELGLAEKRETERGNTATDVEAFEDVNVPFVKRWFDMQKLIKVRNTYLIGIDRETTGGFLHPSFNLHFVITWRSSSDTPNFQNWPNRDPRQAKIVRRAVIPRSPDHVLVSVDYSALEFRGAAMFWRDPAMMRYASDPKLDIHRDMSSLCYQMPTDQVAKDVRSHVKNKFVFPILYGSYYKSTGHDLWHAIRLNNLKRKDGVHLFEHLADKGIRSEEQFIDYMKTVDEKFNKLFPDWSQSAVKWWNDYCERGWFPLMTGFVCHGVFTRNFLMNCPVQGPSFHLMLWAVTRMNEWLKENNMKTKIIGQIHDSMELDVHRDELQVVMSQVKYFMTVGVRKVWDWVTVPLGVEAAIGETNWYEMKPLNEVNGVWSMAA